jgi:hypothetical protein
VGSGKAVQVLDFCCSYRRIADEECSATTPRDLRDECIESETMEALREKALAAYDRVKGGWISHGAFHSG